MFLCPLERRAHEKATLHILPSEICSKTQRQNILLEQPSCSLNNLQKLNELGHLSIGCSQNSVEEIRNTARCSVSSWVLIELYVKTLAFIILFLILVIKSKVPAYIVEAGDLLLPVLNQSSCELILN